MNHSIATVFGTAGNTFNRPQRNFRGHSRSEIGNRHFNNDASWTIHVRGQF